MNGKENESVKFLLSKDLLGNATEEVSSKLAIENDGRGPYQSFMAPVGGILQYSKQVDVILRDKTTVPIVYKSQTSTSTSTITSKKAVEPPSPKASSSANTTQGATSAAPTATRVVIPPKEDVSNSK